MHSTANNRGETEPSPKPYMLRGVLVAIAASLLLAITSDLPGTIENVGKVIRGNSNPVPTPTQTTTRTPTPPNSATNIKLNLSK